jgi:Putative transmembrane protein (PGPGW)
MASAGIPHAMAEKTQPKLARRLEEKREQYQEWPRIARALWVSVAVGVLLGGLALIVLPGPAAIVIPLGLVMLSFEFAWARRLLERGIEKGSSAAEEVKRGSSPAKLLGAAAILCALGAAVAIGMLL